MGFRGEQPGMKVCGRCWDPMAKGEASKDACGSTP